MYEHSPTVWGVRSAGSAELPAQSLGTVRILDLFGPLTSFERSRIQTFPVDWDWGKGIANRNADIELMIGNAVPVNLARAVGEGLVHAIRALRGSGALRPSGPAFQVCQSRK